MNINKGVRNFLIAIFVIAFLFLLHDSASDIFAFACIAAMIATVVFLIMAIVSKVKGNPAKKNLSRAGICFAMIFATAILGAAFSDTDAIDVVKKDDTEVVAKTDANTSEVPKEKSKKSKEAQATPKTQEKAESPAPAAVGSESFAEIYREYKKNEIAANDKYKGNRYRITAKIDGMDEDGFFNKLGKDTITLTLEEKVDNTIVIFYAGFDSETYRDKIKTLSVGDRITFEGKYIDAGNWSECKII